MSNTLIAEKGEKSADLLHLEAFMPYRLAVLATLVSDSFSTTYSDRFGLTIPQWRVMAAIGHAPGSSASKICTYANLDKVQVSRAVAELVQRGLVRRDVDEADRRNMMLTFTARGWHIYENIVPVARDYEKRLLEGFSEDERAQLDRLITKLAERAAAL